MAVTDEPGPVVVVIPMAASGAAVVVVHVSPTTARLEIGGDQEENSERLSIFYFYLLNEDLIDWSLSFPPFFLVPTNSNGPYSF